MKTKRFIKYCNFIAVLTAVFGVATFIKLFNMGYALGKHVAISEKTNAVISHDLLWNIGAEALIAFGILLVSTLFFILGANVRKRLVFVKANEGLLLSFGLAISAFGILSGIIIWLSTHTMPLLSSGLLILVGFCFIFLSFIFKIGINIQEEQELTV